jgi:hypothetical protein
MRDIAEIEIEFLEKLYALSEPGAIVMKNDELAVLAELFVTDETRTANRAGKSGLWCFYCGHSDGEVGPCGCEFPESFRCSGKLVCAHCSKAHRDIGRHLKELFSARRVTRISSVRGNLYRQLFRSALEIGGEDPTNRRELRYWLGMADPFEDEPEAFRSRILRAFGAARFLGFRQLSSQLEEQKSESLIRAIVRAGITR